MTHDCDAIRGQHAYQVYCVSYEDLLQNSHKALEDLLGFLDLPHDRDTIEDLVRRSSFRYTTGRQSGVESRTFYRKGISGDWMNHLDDREKDVFKEIAGDMLIKLGYVASDSW